MASSPVIVDARAVGSAKVAIVPLIAAVIIAVVVSVSLLGGAGYYLIKSGRLTLPASTPVAIKSAPALLPTTHELVLEPVVVNLEDGDGKAYLRVGLTLRIVDPDERKESKIKEENPKEARSGAEGEAAIRDTVLAVLGHQTVGDLLAANGKEQLKLALKAALVQHNPELKVADVFFTEFLVQQ